jgi:hypothetical protein
MAGSDKTVKVSLVADVSRFSKGMNEASTSAKRVGTEAEAMGAKSSAAMSKMSSSSAATTAALRRVENAQDSLRIAELRLADARNQGASGTKLAAAEASVAKARRGLTSATDAHTKALRAESGAAEEASGKFGKLSGSMKGLAVGAGALAGTAVVSFLSDAVKAAGDLEQSVGGVDAVFKQSAEAVHAFGKTAAESVGLSRNEFNELITVTGAMLKNKGLEDFAQKSLDLVQIGADLSATYGGSAKEAVEALNAAMRGESDPIERYGISLNETAVNAELMKKGLNKLTGAALEQAKAQARIDIITRQSADAMGKFASESDTLQGQQQRLNAQWEDAKAQLGQALLPALTNVVQAMRGGVDAALAIAHAFEAIPGPVKAALGAIVALYLVRGPLGGFLASSVEGIKNLTTSLKGVGGVAGGAKAALGGVFDLLGGPWGIAIGAATMALTHWWQEAAKSEQIAGQLKSTLDGVTGAFTEQSKKTIVDSLLGDLNADDIRLLQSMGVNFGELADAILAGGGDLDTYRKHLVDMMNEAYRSEGIFSDQGQALEGLVNSTNRAADGADKTRASQQALAGATKETTTAVAGAVDETTNLDQKFLDVARSMDFAARKQKVQADAAAAARDANKDLATALLDVKAAAGDADAAEISYKRTLDDARERVEKRIELEKELAKARDPKDKARIRDELKNYTATLDTNTRAGQDNLQMLLDLKDRALSSAEANLKNGDSVDSVKKKMADQREEFIKVAKRYGATGDAAKKLADKYGFTKDTVDKLNASMEKTPKKTVLELTLKDAGVKTAIAGVNALLDAAARPRTAFIKVAQIGSIDAGDFIGGGAGTKRAAGGIVYGPGTTTSDSIPAWLSNGEYVIKAAAVARYGKAFFDSVNTMRFAQGGYVSRMTPQAPAIDYERLAALSGGTVINASGLTQEQVAAGVSRGVRDNMFRRSR